MNLCPSCKSRHEASARFCSACGAQLVRDPAVDPETTAGPRGHEPPASPVSHLEHAQALLSAGRSGDALVHLHKALEARPEDDSIRLLIGEAYAAQRSWSEAERYLTRTLEKAPPDSRALRALSEVYEATSSGKELLGKLRALVVLHPSDVECQEKLIKVLAEQFQWEEAEERCRAFLEAQGDRTDLWEIVADCQLAQGKVGEAAATFGKILKLDPKSRRARLHVGIAAYRSSARRGGASRASRHLGDLDPEGAGLDPLERELARLYRAAAALRSGEASDEVEQDLRSVDRSLLPSEHLQELKSCLERLGAAKSGKGGAGRARGTSARAPARNRGPAARKKPSAAEKSRPRRRRSARWLALAFVTAGLALPAAGYFAKGTFEVTVTPAAHLTILRGGEIVATRELPEGSEEATSTITTAPVWYGAYEVRAERPGYRTAVRGLQMGYGRRTIREGIELERAFATVRVASEPPGAEVRIRNAHAEVTGVTPCDLPEVAAEPSSVKVSLAGFEPYEREIEPEPDGTVDLGVIAFKGSLRFDSKPSGAAVTVDGVPAGTTPVKLELPARRHRIELHKAGGGKLARTVTLGPSQDLDLGVLELSALGEFRIGSRPRGAAVFLDGKEAGKTPAVLTRIPPGRHQVRLALPGFVDFERVYMVEAGESFDAGEPSFTGSLQVASRPSGADVYVDGVHRGTTPATIAGLPSKESVLIVRKGDEIFSDRIAVRPEEARDMGTVTLSRFSSRTSNLVLGRICAIETNKAHESTENPNASILTNGIVEGQGHAAGWNNRHDGELMRVTVRCDLGEPSRVTSIRYNVGNVMRAGTWNADRMISPFGTVSTNPGQDGIGAWTAQEGEVVSDQVTITFEKTRRSLDTDWMYISELEVIGAGSAVREAERLEKRLP